MTKPTKWVCAQRRLRSHWASAQSGQSSLSAWRKLGSLATHWAHSATLIRQGGFPDWSESSLGALILSVLSCRGSYIKVEAYDALWHGLRTRVLLLHHYLSPIHYNSNYDISWAHIQCNKGLFLFVTIFYVFLVMVLGSFQCRGVLLLWHMVGQGPAVLAAGAGLVGYVLFVFNLVYPIFIF